MTRVNVRYVQRVDEVVGLDTTEVVPALMISATEESGVVHAAAVVDVRQVVVDAADVSEVDVLFDDTLAAAHERCPVLSPRYCYTVHTYRYRVMRTSVLGLDKLTINHAINS